MGNPITLYNCVHHHAQQICIFNVLIVIMTHNYDVLIITFMQKVICRINQFHLFLRFELQAIQKKINVNESFLHINARAFCRYTMTKKIKNINR